MTPNCITHYRHNPLGHDNVASGLALVLLTRSSCLTPFSRAINTLHFYHGTVFYISTWRPIQGDTDDENDSFIAELGDEHKAQNKIWWAIATTRITWSDLQAAMRELWMCRRNGSCLLCIIVMNCWLKKAQSNGKNGGIELVQRG